MLSVPAAGELYPTDVRTTAHGASAGIAKLGALWASVWFNYLKSRERFWLAASLNSVGIILTLLFTPEPLRVPLLELDRRYAYHTAGKVYHGAPPPPPCFEFPCLCAGPCSGAPAAARFRDPSIST